MKEIQLTRGQVALVDDNMFEKLNQHKWYARKNRKLFYATRMSSRINGKRYAIQMHHEIIGRPPKGYETDHEDGNSLNNQRKNLKYVTHRQNTQNRKNQESSSRYPGVCWHKQNKKWQVHITINGICKHLGCFIDELDAFNVYRQAVETIGEKMVGEL